MLYYPIFNKLRSFSVKKCTIEDNENLTEEKFRIVLDVKISAHFKTFYTKKK